MSGGVSIPRFFHMKRYTFTFNTSDTEAVRAACNFSRVDVKITNDPHSNRSTAAFDRIVDQHRIMDQLRGIYGLSDINE